MMSYLNEITSVLLMRGFDHPELEDMAIYMGGIIDMMKALKKALKKIHMIDKMVYFIYDSLDRKKKEKWKESELRNSIEKKILSVPEGGKEILVLGEERIESLPLMEMFGIIEGGECNMRIPKQSIYQIKDAEVFNNSDVILIKEGAIWNKYYDFQRFDMTIWCDSNVIDVVDKNIYLRKRRNKQNVKVGYSLCGVHDALWAHFLLQFLPKLYAVEDLYKKVGETITIIMSKTNDAHINELVKRFVSRHNYLDLVYIDSDESVKCEKLYYCESINYIMEHSDITTVAASYLTKYSADLLKKNLNIEIEKVKDDSQKPVKLFLERHTQWGHMENQDEVKKFFHSEGFIMIEPHKLSLDEKIRLFNSAECIVGPDGSAFTNVLFCKPGTSVIDFGPYNAMQGNPYVMSFFDKYWGIKPIGVYGKGTSTRLHGNYSVPLERIKEAYRINKYKLN